MTIGMDFGTTNSGMAVYDGQAVRFVPIDPLNPNPYVARTALYITNDRTVHIGRDATDSYYMQNLNRPVKYENVRVGEIEMTFAEVGTFIRDVYIEKDVFAPGRLFLSFKMGLSSPTYLGTIVGSSYYFLEDIIATYLYVTRRRAEMHLDTEIDSIVLGRPVRYSDDPQHNDFARERMLQAAFRAGYKKVYLEHEPIAAAYFYETTIDREENVLVFDFGGGTLDISVLRVGNPKTRRVLATGGIPIAGDEFDRKLVSSKLPHHFGEGTTYRTYDGKELPIPSSFYAAFNNWQDLLLLQRTETLEKIQRIEKDARQPLRIRALINLITSSYALKMYDVAEQSKRQLSENTQTLLRFDGPGFSVRELLTRAEFERIIRSDVRVITERLDAVLDEAGLGRDDIDVVIRTGGSSQIPVFIELLQERFGKDKVRDIDTFSGVTAGLGIMARHLDAGEISLRCYTPETQQATEHLYADPQTYVPLVDLDLMKRLIDLSEGRAGKSHHVQIVTGGSSEHILEAAEVPLEGSQTWAQLGLPDGLHLPLKVSEETEALVLMTTESRLLVKSARELADLRSAGLKLAQVEHFHSDAFGSEAVCGLAHVHAIQDHPYVLVLSTTGYGRLLLGKSFISKLNAAVPYIMPRASSGQLAALVGVPENSEIVIISSTGRAARIPAGQLSTLEARLLRLPRDASIVGAFALAQPQELLIATTSGYAFRVRSDAIPYTELNTAGVKLVNRSNPVAALVVQPEAALWAITSHRLTPVESSEIPLLPPDATTDYKLLKLRKGEGLLTLFYA